MIGVGGVDTILLKNREKTEPSKPKSKRKRFVLCGTNET